MAFSPRIFNAISSVSPELASAVRMASWFSVGRTVNDSHRVWLHADLAGHAHSYQRLTRTRRAGNQISYSVCANGGHNAQRIAPNGAPVLRAPQAIQAATQTNDQTVSETMTIRTTDTFAYS
jgi:hypothetical protein